MLSRILIVAALILVGMVVLKDGRLLRNAHLTGTCSFYQTAADGTEWEACRPGRLEGRPDLSSKGCRSAGLRGNVEYWHCPAAVVASQATR